MAELIDLIKSKPKWQEKINNPAIVQKWKDELNDTYDLPPSVVDTAIHMLKNWGKDNTNPENFEWITRVVVTAEELGIECKCSCKVCSGYEMYCGECGHPENDECQCNMSESDKEEDEYAKEIVASASKECVCDGMLSMKTGAFLKAHVLELHDLVPAALKSKFLEETDHLRTDIPVDYHPGSGGRVIDLIHPSMYPYVANVSKITADRTDRTVCGDATFQWLPSEFSVKDGKTTIGSYINNLDPKYTGLHGSISDIFSLFVPHFAKVLADLNTEKRLPGPLRTMDGPLQVIVKLGETVLTPDNHSFPGGNWHLEGLPHERIVATGIYYYGMDNINRNHLQFRAAVDEYLDYPQDCPENTMDYQLAQGRLNQLLAWVQ